MICLYQVKRNIEYEYVCIYLNSLLRAECDIRSIFQQNTTGLKFFFSETTCLIYPKELILPNYLPITESRRVGPMIKKCEYVAVQMPFIYIYAILILVTVFQCCRVW